MEMFDRTKIIYSDEIEFVESTNEIKVNEIRGLGKCNINVRGSEGPYAHFHIQGTTGGARNKEFHGCICLDKPLYFNHNNMYKDQLKSKNQVSQLDKWLSKPNKQNQKLSNWEYLKQKWNESNVFKIPEEIIKPDYMLLLEKNNITG